MNRKNLVSLVERLGLALLFLPSAGCPSFTPEPAAAPVDPLAHVDPLIGTGGGGFGQAQVFPGATTPFGMVRLGPDTAGDLPRDVVGFAHTAGYWYLDRYIEGFSHLHLSGTGAEDFGTLLVMPTLGMTDGKLDEGGYRQGFSHDNERARVGLYTVTLDDSGVQAELTATAHAGMHRYTFPATTGDADAPTLIFDVGHGIGRQGALDGEVSVDLSAGTLEGWLMSAGRFTGEERAFPIYFSAQLTPPPVAGGTWVDGVRTPGALRVTGADIGAYVQFENATTQVQVRAALSLIDLDQARLNREEVSERSFDDVTAEAERAWREQLGVVQMPQEAADNVTKTLFYTALYHAALMPTLYSESGGRYVGLDREVRHDEGVPYYSELSMWDTYRTAHPLYAALWPQQASAFASSILRMASAIGRLPRWPLAVNETGTMLGSPAAIILADTWLRGARGFNANTALDWMQADSDATDARSSRGGFERCLELGYCPRGELSRPVAHAVEWGWADFATAQLSAALGQDPSRFLERAQLYRGHYDDVTGFLRGRDAQGGFDAEFDPTAMHDDYAEGNAWHYLFSAPYDLAGLASLMGRQALLDKAQELFTLSEAEPPRYVVDEIRAPDPYYWQSNEPDLHAAFVFALAGAPMGTAKWVDWVRRTKYDATPWGIDGNDDGGTLSAWYALAALGLFPLPGSDIWILTAPALDDVTMPMGSGTLHIVTERSAPGAIYPAEVTLDGRAIDRAWLTHEELAAAGELRFVLQAEPTGWGQAEPYIDR